MRIHAIKLKKYLGDKVENGLATDPFDDTKRVLVRDAQVLGHRPIVEREDGVPVDVKAYVEAFIAKHGGQPDEIGWNEVAGWEERLQDVSQTERISPRHLASPNLKMFEAYYATEMGEKNAGAERQARTLAALRYNQRYAVVLIEGSPKIYEYKTDRLYKIEDHKKTRAHDHFFTFEEAGEGEKRGKNKRTQSWDAWFGHPARAYYPDVVFAPRGKDTKGRDVDLSFALNMWTEPVVKPKKGDCTPILDFLRGVVCDGNEEHFRYLIGWNAHMYQQPHDKPGVAIGMIGGQGTGKGTTGDVLLEMIGPKLSVYTYKDKHFAGDFSVTETPPLFHFHDESTSGNKSVAANQRAQITETRDQVERKGDHSRSMASYTRFMFATNDEDGFAVHGDDRRHFVLRVSDAWKGDKKQFAALRKHMFHNGGMEAFAYYLRFEVRLSHAQEGTFTLDLTSGDDDFDVRSPPMTAAKQEMIQARLAQGPQAVLSMLKEGRLYGRGTGEGRTDVEYTLERDVPTWIDKNDIEAVLSPKFGGATKTKLYQELKRWGVVDGERNAHKARGVKASYRFCPLSEARASFLEHHKLPADTFADDAYATDEERIADAAAALVRLVSETRRGASLLDHKYVKVADYATQTLKEANKLTERSDAAAPDLGVGPEIDESYTTVH